MKHNYIAAMIAMISCFSMAQEEPDQEPMTEQYVLAKITAKIVGEDGNFIEGSNVNIRFPNVEEYKDGFNDFHGKSDIEGLFSGESKITGSCITIIANKDGYYESDLFYQPEYALNRNIKPSEKFQPWNPTIPVILKKIGNPIPMIVRRNSSSYSIRYAPKIGEEIGFDMMKYDWIKPHGEGDHSDFSVFFSSDFIDIENYLVTMRLKMENPDDGLIPIVGLTGEESRLKYPRTASETGYNLKTVERSASAGSLRIEPQDEETDGYFFRIRTEKDPETGRITSAYYGKIVARDSAGRKTSPFLITPSMYKNEKLDTTPGISFAHYINPTPNDRNLEYDQKTNLAPEWKGGVFGAAP